MVAPSGPALFRAQVAPFLVLFVGLLLPGAVADQTATPVARVISLLEKLSAQITKEGKKEAAEYDKYACWCKEQADNTQYSIEKSEAMIEELTAEIKKLEAEIKDLDEDIKELKKTISDLEDDIDELLKKRKKENDKYKEDATYMVEGIDALKEAIEAMKESKGKMKDSKQNFIQLQSTLLDALTLSSVAPSAAQLQLVKDLAQAPADPAKHHAYTYQSNSVIETLKTLLLQFEDIKKELDDKEREALFKADKKQGALLMEKKFAEKEKTEKTTLMNDKTKEKEDKEKVKKDEEDMLEDDEGFLKEVTSDCQTKAEDWDQRSKVRADELKALSEATTSLKEGVKPNYNSNALSFLQVRGSHSSSAAQRVASFVADAAKVLESRTLSGLAAKLNVEGHFDKVKKLIEDLIKKLEDEAKAEADSKTFCDKNMKKAVEKRDQNQLDMEAGEAKIAMKTAEINKLKEANAKLDKEVAELTKALLEATELRSEEKAENEVTLDEAKAGKEAVDDAIETLKTFYEGQALLQKGPAENRDGLSVGDAPKLSYDDGDKYKGKQGQSKGIIGILEVIQSDFQRTVDTVEADEKSSQSDFEDFEKKSKDDVKDKTKTKKDNEDLIKKATTSITDAKDDIADAKDLLEGAMKQLEELQAMCMAGEGTFEERKKQREEEIKTLKKAIKILDDW